MSIRIILVYIILLNYRIEFILLMELITKIICILFSFLAIEDDYKGPALEDGKVTLKFMLELMDHYKQQKKLHRKYAYKVSKKKTTKNRKIIFVLFVDLMRH